MDMIEKVLMVSLLILTVSFLLVMRPMSYATMDNDAIFIELKESTIKEKTHGQSNRW